MDKRKRIDNLEFRKASYLCKEPEHPSYHISKWDTNGYYGHEDKYIKDGDYYRDPRDEYNFVRIHKSCFKSPETSYAIASFNWDDHEGIYELHFVGDRPLCLSKEEREAFMEGVRLGFQVASDRYLECLSELDKRRANSIIVVENNERK